MSDGLTCSARVEGLDNFARTFDEYWKLTRKSRIESLNHASRNFSTAATKAMKSKMAAKGAITSERISAFKAGSGLRISKRAYAIVRKQYGAVDSNGRTYLIGRGKRGLTKKQAEEIRSINIATKNRGVTLQVLLAKKELSLREAHRAFTSASLLFKKIESKFGGTSNSKASGKIVGRQEVKNTNEDDSFSEFSWGSSISVGSAFAARGVSSRKGETSIDEGLNAAANDMRTYIARKAQQNFRAAKNAFR